MKNYKRAYRRYKKYVKFKKRLDVWIKPNTDLFINKGVLVYKRKVDIIKEALKGECYTFLRTTSRPCNCYMCSTYEKYKRTPKSVIQKEIFKQISNDCS